MGKAGNLYEDAGYELSGAAYVIDKYLGTSWLWDRVRVVGGAYGGFCSFDPQSGLFSYLSYRCGAACPAPLPANARCLPLSILCGRPPRRRRRCLLRLTRCRASFACERSATTTTKRRDPNLLPTLEAYDGAPGFLRSLELDSDALTKAIIGTIGDVDAYQLPDAKGYAAMSRCAPPLGLGRRVGRREEEDRAARMRAPGRGRGCLPRVSTRPRRRRRRRRRRYLLGVTDDERQQRRDEILGTTQKDFRRFAETLEVLRGDGAARVVAVTSADKAKAVLEERPGFWEVKRVI